MMEDQCYYKRCTNELLIGDVDPQGFTLLANSAVQRVVKHCFNLESVYASKKRIYLKE